MNIKTAIAHHGHLVSSRNSLADQAKEEALLSEDAPRPITERRAELEREISILGQAHNPRISAKSLAALNLN